MIAKINQYRLYCMNIKNYINQRQLLRIDVFHAMKKQKPILEINKVLIQLLYISEQIKNKKYTPQIINQLKQNYSIDTDKQNQQIQYLLDISIVVKVNFKYDKKQNIKSHLKAIKFIKIKNSQKLNISYPQSIIKYNFWKQKLTRYQAILKSILFFLIELQLKYQFQLFIAEYKQLIVSNYQQLDIGTAYFQIGNMYINFNDKKPTANYLNIALDNFNKCKAIRSKFPESLPLADTMYNTGIIYFKLNMYENAIINLQSAYRINKDKGDENKEDGNNLKIAIITLTLGKAYIKISNLQKATKYILESFKIQSYFTKKRRDNQKMNQINNSQKKLTKKEIIEINKIQKDFKNYEQSKVLLIFLYRTLTQNYKIRKTEQLNKIGKNFVNQLLKFPQLYDYRIQNSNHIQYQHLQLEINSEFFNKFSSKGIEQFVKIQKQLKKINIQEGFKLLINSQFLINNDISYEKILNKKFINEVRKKTKFQWNQ